MTKHNRPDTQLESSLAIANAMARIEQRKASLYETEQSVLGTLILYPSRLETVGRPDFGPQSFGLNRRIAEVVFSIISETGKAGFQLVATKCVDGEIASRLEVSEMCAKADPDTFDDMVFHLLYTNQVVKEARLRMDTVTALASGEELELVLAVETQRRNELSYEIDEKKRRDDAYNAYLSAVEARMKKTLSTAPDWPWRDITRRIGRFEPGRVVIIAARPGMGKTTITIQASLHVARQAPTLFISLEMSHDEVLSKLVQAKCGLDRERVQSGEISPSALKQVVDTVGELYDTPLFIEADIRPELSVITQTIRQYARKQGVKVVVIDYLQLLNDSAGGNRSSNREQEVSRISRALKAVAKQEKVCIVEICQLSRMVETRGGTKRPLLSDLRESGQLEQDADAVSFLYRPAAYNIQEDENGESTKGVMEFIVAKNRHYGGGVGISKLHHHSETDTLHESPPAFELPKEETGYQYNPRIEPALVRPGDETIPF